MTGPEADIPISGTDRPRLLDEYAAVAITDGVFRRLLLELG
ncbi:MULTISPECIES: hypothetical protein [Frankia]|nr:MULTISPECIES: hypothetical protein [Frankia]